VGGVEEVLPGVAHELGPPKKWKNIEKETQIKIKKNFWRSEMPEGGGKSLVVGYSDCSLDLP